MASGKGRTVTVNLNFRIQRPVQEVIDMRELFENDDEFKPFYGDVTFDKWKEVQVKKKEDDNHEEESELDEANPEGEAESKKSNETERTPEEVEYIISRLIEGFNKQEFRTVIGCLQFIHVSDRESESRMIQRICEQILQHVIDDFVDGAKQSKLIKTGEPLMLAISANIINRMIYNKVVKRKILDRCDETFPALAAQLSHWSPDVRYHGLHIAHYTLLHVKRKHLDKACDYNIFAEIVKTCLDPHNEAKDNISEACQIIQFSMEEGSRKLHIHLLFEIKVLSALEPLHLKCQVPRIKNDKSLQSSIECCVQIIGLYMGRVDPGWPVVKNVPKFGKSSNKVVRELLTVKCSKTDCNVYEVSDEWTFKSCERCQICRYCSRKCQLDHWKLEHKGFCQSNHRCKRDSKQRLSDQTVEVTFPTHMEKPSEPEQPL